MAKVSMDCPTPGCKEVLLVKKNKIGKPSMFCKRCGFQAVVRYAWAVEAWLGEEEAVADDGKGKGLPKPAPGPSAESSPAKGIKKDLWDLK